MTGEGLAREAVELIHTPQLPELGGGDDVGIWLQQAYLKSETLSGGERILVSLANVFWNGNPEMRVSQLAQLDALTRVAVVQLLVRWVREVLPR